MAVFDAEMKNIEVLKYNYLSSTLMKADYKSCVDWAIKQLQQDEDLDNLNVILLAGCSIDSSQEISEYTSEILKEFSPISDDDQELVYGKYLVHLYEEYTNKNISIDELDHIILKMYNKLNHPDWLVMLSRNCEYATDIQSFVDLFEKEFEYVIQIWQKVITVKEFNSIYSRDISNNRDLPE